MAASDRKSVLAVILIVIGSILLLDKLNFFFIPWYFFTWQFLLIGIGFLIIITQEKWEGGLVLITIGTAFLLPRIFDISMRDVFNYWPVILILIGVVTLVRHLDGDRNQRQINGSKTGETNKDS